jgi:hypothetical protein
MKKREGKEKRKSEKRKPTGSREGFSVLLLTFSKKRKQKKKKMKIRISAVEYSEMEAGKREHERKEKKQKRRMFCSSPFYYYFASPPPSKTQREILEKRGKILIEGRERVKVERKEEG